MVKVVLFVKLVTSEMERFVTNVMIHVMIVSRIKNVRHVRMTSTEIH